MLNGHINQYIQAWKAQPYPGSKHDLQKLKHLVLVDVFYGVHGLLVGPPEVRYESILGEGDRDFGITNRVVRTCLVRIEE